MHILHRFLHTVSCLLHCCLHTDAACSWATVCTADAACSRAAAHDAWLWVRLACCGASAALVLTPTPAESGRYKSAICYLIRVTWLLQLLQHADLRARAGQTF